ncbi:hypothetical protein [Lysobacter gummosus]|uniref:hypothetical protein n=1 Tax=Lysobacter gummosus TaxID=262324 RepID=UPI00363E253F
MAGASGECAGVFGVVGLAAGQSSVLLTASLYRPIFLLVIPANAGSAFTSAEPNIQRPQRHSTSPSFPRRRESSAFRARTFEVAGFPRSRE